MPLNIKEVVNSAQIFTEQFYVKLVGDMELEYGMYKTLFYIDWICLLK